MKQDARIAAVIEVLEHMNNAWSSGEMVPADVLIGRYYRDRRYMGSKDRREVSNYVYAIIRKGGALEWRLEQENMEAQPREMVLMLLATDGGLTRHEIEHMFTGKHHAPEPLSLREQMLIDAAEGTALITDEMPDWARHNIPDFAAPWLKEKFGDHFEEAMGALEQQAPVDLRVNPLKGSREDIIFELDKLGHNPAQTPHSPLGIRLRERLSIQALDVYKDGSVEVMDEGSQLVASLVQAEPGDTVIDFCAGAGGKTLAIAEKMRGEGTVYAWDTDAKRLKQMKPRLKRAGVHNVLMRCIKGEQDEALAPYKRTADWVLVDVPCSGSGTWRRNPDGRWRYMEEDIHAFAKKQASILAAASQFVKPGGSIVYSTCSLYSQENEAIIGAFCVDNPDFRIADLPETWNEFYSWIEGVGTAIQALPHRHQTDGFFAACLEHIA